MNVFEKDIILSIVLVVGTIVLLNLTKSFLRKLGRIKQVDEKRVYYVSKSINFLIASVALSLFAFIWSVSLDGMLVFASSIFAVIGVALFAQWSILSNLTSSIIIFFAFPSRIGDEIKIVDGDNSVEGKILDIELFHIKILDKDENIIIYPNNLFIQRPIIKKKK